MKINFKDRFKNKVFLTAFLSIIITAIYQILGLLGITATISEETVINGIGLVLTILGGFGVIVNPLTPGLGDQDAAQTHTEPK